MTTVRVEPAGITFDVEPGETVFNAAHRHGYSWPTVCGGQGSCRACVLSVVGGDEHLPAIGRWEREGLDAVTPALPGDPSRYRLACQVQPSGDITVHKTGVRALRS